MFGDDSADKSLKCRNLNWAETLMYTMVDTLGDTLCQIIPWTCSENSSPGWEWWKILLVVLGGIALIALLVFMYRKFFSKKKTIESAKLQ
jgi:H+/Cl- antiporter ClcA